jgi:two-component system response regulator RpfG
MVTADEDPEMRLEALEAGATEFMVKPVNHHECRKLCRKLLIQYRQ